MEPTENSGEQKRQQKHQLILALVMTALLAVVVGTLAWLNYDRSLQTITKVDMPALWLRGGYSEDTASIELGNIDVENAIREKDYVFSVVSTTTDPYILQLAHTTNIPFIYTIYPATISEVAGSNSVQYGAYFYNYSTALESGGILPNTHEKTYGDYSSVQRQAEPVYWQSEIQQVDLNQRDGKNFIRYYILRISWDENQKNNKETDMVYLTVGTANTASNTTTGGSK